MPNTTTTMLSKTRFKEGFECPTKLYFRRHRDRYPCEADRDPFLRHLANGGFQVGALAQLSYPGGILVDTLDFDDAQQETARLMKRPQVVIFEAAFRHDALIVRVDILVKNGRDLRLIEVKSKSFDDDDAKFWKKAKGAEVLTKSWTPYLADVAFQTMVCRQSCPTLSVRPFLMLANKDSRATVSGLHQKFRLIESHDGRAVVRLSGEVSREALGAPILQEMAVAGEVEGILAGTASGRGSPLAEEVALMSDAFVQDRRIDLPVDRRCRKCAYRKKSTNGPEDIESGFESCWRGAHGVGIDDLRTRPLVLDMPKVPKYEHLLRSGRIFQDQLTQSQVTGARGERPEGRGRPGLNQASRYWKQIEKTNSQDLSPFVDRAGLGDEMASWEYPFHFIDFETMTAAIPFHRGLRPYEMLAFQFSHHTLAADGTVRHQTQWLETEPGKFPNFDFTRALKAALGEHGTVFCYSPHENTVLLQILRQLDEHSERPDDRQALAEWIKSVSIKRNEQRGKPPHWTGRRVMVDLLDVLKRFVLYPVTHGSCSLKDVLPACMSASEQLRQKYSKSVYGAAGGIFSHNFRDMAWWRGRKSDGGAIDPYALLASAVEGSPRRPQTTDKRRGLVTHGPEAMAAFERLQYVDISEDERKGWEESLLRYCELDTLAMVMLVESWREEVDAGR